jgi:RHS repeat-associated protein
VAESYARSAAHLHKQYVWGLRQVDAPVLRDRETDAAAGLDERLYYTQDGNFNVTALVNPAGEVVERYSYDAYGRVTVRNGAENVDADTEGDPATEWDADPDNASDVDNCILYCGYRFDSDTGLYHVRHRYLHPTLGRWTTRDPLGYLAGMHLYGYVGSNPLACVDPLGLAPKTALEKYKKVLGWWKRWKKIYEYCKNNCRNKGGKWEEGLKKMVDVNGALVTFKNDLKKEIMDAIDSDKSQELLKKSGILDKAKAIAEADKNLSHVERKIKDGVNRRLAKYVRDQVEDTGFDTSTIKGTADSIKSAVDTIGALKELTSGESNMDTMQTALNLALDHVGGKVPGLGPMMKYYSEGVDSAFDGLDTINWSTADKKLPRWKELCDDPGGTGLLSHHWAETYVPGSLMTTGSKSMVQQIEDWLASW